MMEYLRELFGSAQIIDFIDIGVITVFIYLLLVWFEQARARFVMIGLFILGSVYILARLFGLYLTTAVFQAFFAVFLIMVMIIFQDEFRRFFERIAVWGIIRHKKRFTSFNSNVDILTNALINLANKKIGALVVIKGKDPLERHIEGGVPLGGLISQIMLEAIFDPHVPSHDGAVIIEGERIIKFGSHLPLSVNTREIYHLGTRHAAALGLAERTDALCLAVSEEKGIISVAEGDNIIQLKDMAALRLRLEGFYCKKFPHKKRAWPGLLTGHILEKVIALILACGIWLLFGHRQEMIRRDLVIPLEYRNLASDWIIAELKPNEATVSLSGSESAFNFTELKDLKISMDMSKVKEGDNEFLLAKDSIRSPAGISVVNITPEKIVLKAYKMLSFDVPVEAATFGRLPAGIVLNNIMVEPQTVSVTAPSTINRGEIKITTEGIDLRKISQTQTIEVKLILPEQVRLKDEKQRSAKVTIAAENK